MNKLPLLTLLLVLGCNPNKQSDSQPGNKLNNVEPCPPGWMATGKTLKQFDLNDSTEQVFLNDTLWFEVIGHATYGESRHISHIKNYRTNGRLEEEGNAIYFDHPLADYEKHGHWKFYDCNGQLFESKEFFEGKVVNAN